MTQGMLAVHKMAIGPNFIDHIKGKGLLAHLNSFHKAPDPSDNLITDDQ